MECNNIIIGVIGLGYVGLPLAVAFSKKFRVIGFDINCNKIKKYSEGIDLTNEVGNLVLEKSKIEFTSDIEKLREVNFYIVAVPTPISKDRTPNLKSLTDASEIVGKTIKKNDYVVFESTVYPGVTEEICAIIIDNESGLKFNLDYKIGYSPERINPGDKEHSVENIVKIVSGCCVESCEFISSVYGEIVTAGIYKAASIKIAEAAKVIENTQRDINIAFINELSIIFNKMGIDTKAVLDAAKTKWNFIDFRPGLVGGHCIGVDPYYLTYKAEELGYHPEVILSGRRINDGMGKYIAENTIKCLIKANTPIKGSRVLILGATFKENVADIRNSRVIDIVKELIEYGVDVYLEDPLVEIDEIIHKYEIDVKKYIRNKVDAVVLAVVHDKYKSLDKEEIKKYYFDSPLKNKVLIDVKGMFDKELLLNEGYIYWRL